MRSGVIIIEILIGTVIAALLSTALLATIMQVSFAQKHITNVTSEYIRVATVFQQLQRDINGAFMPTQAEKKRAPKKDIVDQKGAQGQVQKEPKKQEEKEEPILKPIDKVFYGSVKDNRFDVLSCITNNPLEIYIHAKNNKPKPRVARVVYRLEQDQKRKKSYRLMRQEGIDLSFESYAKDAKQPSRAYEVIDGIAELSVQYVAMEVQKKDGDNVGNKEVKMPTYKKSNQWGLSNQENSAEQSISPDDTSLSLLPHEVEIKLVLWDASYEKMVPFTMTIPLYAQAQQAASSKDDREQEKPKEEPKVEETKGESNPDASAKPPSNSPMPKV